MAKKIRTVLGDIETNDIGITNCHAHIEVDVCSHHFDERYLDHRLRFEDAVPELLEFKKFGGMTICELTPMGLGRNPSRVAEISRKTGVQIIMGTGIYHELFHPFEIRRMDVDSIAEMFIRDINVGIQNTGIRAGMIGEVGTYDHSITEREEIVFKASSIAALETGVAISTHTHAGKLALEQVELFLKEGVSADRIIIGHLDDRSPLESEVPLIYSLLDTGVWIQFDDIGFEYFSKTLGIQMPSDKDRLKVILSLIEDGFEDQILLGSDVCKSSHLKSNGGPGFVHFVKEFVSTAKDFGIPEVILKKLLIDNPAAALGF